MSHVNGQQLLSLLTLALLLSIPVLAGEPRVIDFRSPNLYPEGMAWDPSHKHFIVGSLRHRSLLSVSAEGLVHTLIFDPSLPPNSTILGIAVDDTSRRLLAAVNSLPPLPPFVALAAYDLRSKQRIFLAQLPSGGATQRPVANAVAVDPEGNAYVTNSPGNFIWKVSADGHASVFSRSPAFTKYPVADEIRKAPFGDCGLNGVAHLWNGHLLVVQSNTGKLFKVDEKDGTAREVALTEDLTWADDVAVRGDGVVLIVSQRKLWFLRSEDDWGAAEVYDGIGLEEEGFATSVAVAEERAYVLYGRAVEGILGNGDGREWFRIVEVRSASDVEEDSIWVFVMVGLALAVFLVWRFQMRQLISGMDKKIR